MVKTTQSNRAFIKQELSRAVNNLDNVKNHLVNAGTPFLDNISLLNSEGKEHPELYDLAVETTTQLLEFVETIQATIKSLDEQI